MIINMHSEKKFNILFMVFFMFSGILVFFAGNSLFPEVSYGTGKFIMRSHLNKYYTLIETSNSSHNHKVSASLANYRRGYIGIQITQLPDAGLKIAGSNVMNGILVKEVYTGSPAYKSGITAGNIILSINGKSISHPDDAIYTLENSPIGKTINVILQSKNKIIERHVTTEEWPNFSPFNIQNGHLQTTRNE